MLPILFSALAAAFLLIHLATMVAAWRRCRPSEMAGLLLQSLPPVTVVRPLCGLETFSVETLNAAFRLDYPNYELLFCVAQANDPIVPLVRTAIAAYPDVDARLLIGDDIISKNPKLNNMVKGWREAAHDWIVFIDSNVLVTPDFVRRCVLTWQPDTGAISAPPAGIMPGDFGGFLECAFLNTYEARWQYAVAAAGQGFAQGKTLFYRKADLDRTGLRELAAEPAEDAATTKMVRRMGLRVRLAPPSPMPIGRRSFSEVWSRQLRWARLRRATFPTEFLPEIASGSVVPVSFAIAAAALAGWPVLPIAGVYLAMWFAAEYALAVGCGWPAGWRLPFALVLRDALMPFLFAGAFAGRSFTWKGTAMEVEESAWRRKLRTIRWQPRALGPGGSA